MANVIIEHKDGRRYSTTRAGFRKLYEDEGFKIVGEETGDAFVLSGVPAQKAPRPAVRAKGKGKRKAAPARPVARIPAESSAPITPAEES